MTKHLKLCCLLLLLRFCCVAANGVDPTQYPRHPDFRRDVSLISAPGVATPSTTYAYPSITTLIVEQGADGESSMLAWATGAYRQTSGYSSGTFLLRFNSSGHEVMRMDPAFQLALTFDALFAVYMTKSTDGNLVFAANTWRDPNTNDVGKFFSARVNESAHVATRNWVLDQPLALQNFIADAQGTIFNPNSGISSCSVAKLSNTNSLTLWSHQVAPSFCGPVFMEFSHSKQDFFHFTSYTQSLTTYSRVTRISASSGTESWHLGLVYLRALGLDVDRHDSVFILYRWNYGSADAPVSFLQKINGTTGISMWTVEYADSRLSVSSSAQAPFSGVHVDSAGDVICHYAGGNDAIATYYSVIFKASGSNGQILWSYTVPSEYPHAASIRTLGSDAEGKIFYGGPAQGVNGYLARISNISTHMNKSAIFESIEMGITEGRIQLSTEPLRNSMSSLISVCPRFRQKPSTSSAWSDFFPERCAPLLWWETDRVSVNLTNLEPFSEHDVQFAMADVLLEPVIRVATLQCRVWWQGEQPFSVIGDYVSVFHPLSLNLSIAAQGPSQLSLRVCAAAGFYPPCASLSRTRVGLANDDEVPDYLSFSALQLARLPSATYSIGNHTVFFSVSLQDPHPSVTFNPSLALSSDFWLPSASFQVRGYILANWTAESRVIVSSLPPPSMHVELFPGPPAPEEVLVHFVAFPTALSDVFDVASHVAVGASSTEFTVRLALQKHTALAQSAAVLQLHHSSTSAELQSLITVDESVFNFSIHNGIECHVWNTSSSPTEEHHTSAVYLYPGQSTRDVGVTVGCVPTLNIAPTSLVQVHPSIPGAELLVSLSTPSVLLRNGTISDFDITALSLVSITSVRTLTVSLPVVVSSPDPTQTPELYPVNANGASLNVVITPTDGIVRVPALVRMAMGERCEHCLRLSVSRDANYNLTVIPSTDEAHIQFDPPYATFAPGRSEVTFSIQALSGAVLGSSLIRYSLSGSDAMGFSLNASNSTLRLQGSLSLIPKAMTLFGNSETWFWIVASSLPPPGAGALHLNFSAAAAELGISVNPATFVFHNGSSIRQRVKCAYLGTPTTLASPLSLMPDLQGDAAELYEAPSWPLRISDALPNLCSTISSFAASTTETRVLQLPVTISSSSTEDIVLVYGKAEGPWHVCSALLSTAQVLQGATADLVVVNGSCSVAPNVGAGYLIGIGLLENPDNPSVLCGGLASFSYPPPELFDFSLRLESPAAPGERNVFGSSVSATDTVFMDGVNFGSNTSKIRVTYGAPQDPTQFSCTVEYLAHVGMRQVLGCRMSLGGGLGLVFRVDVDGQAVTGTDTYSYPTPPVISCITSAVCDTSNCQLVQCPTMHPQPLVTITGQYFSRNKDLMQASVAGQLCDVLNSSDTQLICTLPVSSGVNQEVRVSRTFRSVWLSSQTNTSEASSWKPFVSYASPHILSLQSQQCQQGDSNVKLVDCPRNKASLVLTVGGQHFGPTPTVIVGGSICMETRVVRTFASNDTQFLECVMAPGNDINQPVMVLTPQGLFSPSATGSLISFKQCPAGFQQIRVNGTQLECLECSRYRFQATPGSPNCEPCPSGQYKNSADPTLPQCALCPSKGASCFPGQPVLSREGFWLLSTDNETVSSLICSPGRCLAAEQCFQSSAAAEDTNLPAVSCCSSGRKNAQNNILCGECLPEFSEWNGRCLECPGVNVGLLFAAMLGGWLLLIFLHATTKRQSGAKFAITISFLQTVRACTADDPDFPTLITALASLDMASSTGNSQCLMPMSGLTLAILPFLQVLLFYALLLFATACNYMFSRLPVRFKPCETQGMRQQRASDETPQFSFVPYLRVGLALLVMSFIPTLRSTVLLGKCIDVGSKSVVKAFPTVECSGAGYTVARTITSLTSALMAVGIAAITILYAPAYIQQLDKERLGMVGFCTRFLFHKYRPHDIGSRWNIVLLLRNATVVLLGVLVDDWRTRFALLSGVISLFTMLQLLGRPYRLQEDNWIETTMLTCLMLFAVLNTPEWNQGAGLRTSALTVYYCTLFGLVVLFAQDKTLSFFKSKCKKSEDEVTPDEAHARRKQTTIKRIGMLAKAKRKCAELPWHHICWYMAPDDSATATARGTTNEAKKDVGQQHQSLLQLSKLSPTNDSESTFPVLRGSGSMAEPLNHGDDVRVVPQQHTYLATPEPESTVGPDREVDELQLDMASEARSVLRRKSVAEALPPGWEVLVDENNNDIPYYYHRDDGVVSWEKPTLPSPPAGAEVAPEPEAESTMDRADNLTQSLLEQGFPEALVTQAVTSIDTASPDAFQEAIVWMRSVVSQQRSS